MDRIDSVQVSGFTSFCFYQSGGGQVKIESKKLDFKAAPKIEAKNEAYKPKGGDKKVGFDQKI